jgi:DNA end-binding protein Ku
MRPYWKGYLKLALVSCPIALHAACSTAERIAFRQINKATGNRLRQQLIDEETREPVDPEYKGCRYEVAKGQYLIVEDEELEAIEIESTHVIEIDSFVPRQQIDGFFDSPYHVALNEPVAQEAFAVMREAMRQDYFADLPELTLAPGLLTLATQILESAVADFDPNAFDRYEQALLAHLKAKQAGTIQDRKPTFPTPRRVIILMEALRRSVSEDKKPAPPRRRAPSSFGAQTRENIMSRSRPLPAAVGDCRTEPISSACRQ